MAKINIGCAGWDYKDWMASFYPKSLEKYNRLKFYSRFFDLIEINTTFYNVPKYSIVKKWNGRVPEKFKYVIKVWQKITHDLKVPNLAFLISQFFYHLSPIQEKTVAYLLQFPPWFKFTEKHFKQLNNLTKELPSGNMYIFEFRDNSWFKKDLISEFIDGTKFILGTTYKPGLKAYYSPNQDRYYIRLIGDRELTVFSHIQRNQEKNLSDLIQKVNNLEKSPDVREILIIVNNHFMGFAPESVNLLKKRFNLPFYQFNQQKRLSDYF